MNRNRTWTRLATLTVLAAPLLLGCDDSQPTQPLAPTATALAPAPPKAAGALRFAIDKLSSKVEFMMEAPVEKIRGRASASTEGDLHVDPSDLTKTTGLVAVDISGLELFQAVQGEDGKFGEEKKSDLQNAHARTWLEISDDAPEDVRKKNARVEFSIQSIQSVSEKDVQKLTGAERKVTFTATGELLLHGRKTTKTAELEATFRYEGDKPVSVTVKSVKPFPVGLEEHDVRPRDAFGRFAKKALSDLSQKVASEAQVSVELTAKLAGGAGGGATPAKTDVPKP